MVSTIAIATSSIVTTVIIAVGVVVFSPVLPYLTDENSVFAPAFQQVVPALFGALGISYFVKHWKIAVVPVSAIVLILLFQGSLATGVLIPIGVVISMLAAHLMFKKVGWINNAGKGLPFGVGGYRPAVGAGRGAVYACVPACGAQAVLYDFAHAHERQS